MVRRESSVKLIIAVAVLLIIASAVLLLFSFRNHTTVQIGSQLVSVSIADTDAERAQGLSGTSSLADDQGMLFIFTQSEKWPIWMKDMNYSIDVVWLDQNRMVVDVDANVSPETYPQDFVPRASARYVLELPAGYAARHGIGIGTLATITGWFW